MTVLTLGLVSQLFEILGPGARRFFREHMAAGLKGRVDRLGGLDRFQAHNHHFGLEALEHVGRAVEGALELVAEQLASAGQRLAAWVSNRYGVRLLDLGQGPKVVRQMSASGIGDHSHLDGFRHR